MKKSQLREPSTKYRLPTISILALILIAAGCSSEDSNCWPVAGSIKTKSGTNCDNALVVFHPTDPADSTAPRASATCDENGEFQLTTDTFGDGAQPGKYNVTVVWFKQKKSKMSLSSESSGGTDALKGRYGNPNAGTLTAEVFAESENRFDFVVQ